MPVEQPQLCPPVLKGANIRLTAKRLALREYLPFGSWLATWFLFGLALGHADVVRLLAANTFAQAARAVCTLEVMQVLARRAHACKEIWRASLLTGLRIECAGLAACALLVAGLTMLLAWRGMSTEATMIVIVACGIPARNPGVLLVAKRNRLVSWRAGSSLVAVTGAAAIFLLELPWQAAALVLALRDWGGLAATALFGTRREAPDMVPSTALTFEEAAAQTEASARRRLGYRLIRTLLMALMGPFGGFAARTGRSAGTFDTKIARLMPRSKPGFVLFTASMAGAAAVLLSISREPLALLGAAACARLSALGAAVLLWWKHRDLQAGDEDEEAEL